MALEVGQEVTIYKEPRSETKKEGTATLVRCINPAFDIFQKGRVLQIWSVRFDGEKSMHRRGVLTPAEEESG